MIHDIKIKRLKLIPDERGFLMEMLRSDDQLFKKFGQAYITGVKYGTAKGWHYHRKQLDHFVCVAGSALLVLYDARKDSPTYGKVQEIILQSPPCDKYQPVLVQIPTGVMHGFTATNCKEARIINIPTKKYNYKKPDEYRLPWNDTSIPYKWPKQVKYGG